jgi:hypothetical protein
MAPRNVVKTFAFVFGFCILAIGVGGLIAPSFFEEIAGYFVTSGAFYGLAVVRVAFGLALIFVASASRSPKAIRVLGCLIVIAGIGAALAGLFGLDWARASIAMWMQQGSVVLRLTGIPIAALGGFIAYACAPRINGARPH